MDPPRYGGHWEEIGFQGTDPATDLRGVGMIISKIENTPNAYSTNVKHSNGIGVRTTLAEY